MPICADFENVAKVDGTAESFVYSVMLKCSNCGTETEKLQTFTAAETHGVSTGRAEAHYVAKCKFCKRESTLSIVERSPYTSGGEFATICVVDARGWEVASFDAGASGPFVVEADSSGTRFADDVDLSEGDWADYDEEGDQQVALYDIKTRCETA